MLRVAVLSSGRGQMAMKASCDNVHISSLNNCVLDQISLWVPPADSLTLL